MPATKNRKQFIAEEEAMFCPFKRCWYMTPYCKRIPFMHRIKDHPDLFYCYHSKRMFRDLRNEKGACNASV